MIFRLIGGHKGSLSFLDDILLTMPQQKNTDMMSISRTNSDTGSTSTPHTLPTLDDKGVRQKESNVIGDYEDKIGQIDLFTSAPRSPRQQKKGMKSFSSHFN